MNGSADVGFFGRRLNFRTDADPWFSTRFGIAIMASVRPHAMIDIFTGRRVVGRPPVLLSAYSFDESRNQRVKERTL